MLKLSALGTRALMALALLAGLALVALPSSAQQTTPTPAPGTGPAKHHHPSHMHAALHELKEARHELKEAKHDFGGHREAALKAVDHAIHQIELALEYHHAHKKQ
jgi:Spy/CpxP family protein refolding chaperone